MVNAPQRDDRNATTGPDHRTKECWMRSNESDVMDMPNGATKIREFLSVLDPKYCAVCYWLAVSVIKGVADFDQQIQRKAWGRQIANRIGGGKLRSIGENHDNSSRLKDDEADERSAKRQKGFLVSW
ncbi:hypothetical protein TNCV_4177751 [Trichonephila clavipes]|nr:hypothetical protein TNCV_4177751 [Trichonephila clavipes]